MSSLVLNLKRLIYQYVPLRFKLLFKVIWYALTKNLEPEMRLAVRLTNKHRRFIDVGANSGIYSFIYTSAFQKIESFEPLQEVIAPLEAMKLTNVSIHKLALSSRDGTRTIFVPTIQNTEIPSLASFNRPETECHDYVVCARTLDSFDFKDVDLIKIDVEGHELEVLEGAIQTITNSMPILLVEIEQRHSPTPIRNTFEYLLNLGYSGYFLYKGVLEPLKTFDYIRHQQSWVHRPTNKNYINNFIFIPSDKIVLTRSIGKRARSLLCYGPQN